MYNLEKNYFALFSEWEQQVVSEVVILEWQDWTLAVKSALMGESLVSASERVRRTLTSKPNQQLGGGT